MSNNNIKRFDILKRNILDNFDIKFRNLQINLEKIRQIIMDNLLEHYIAQKLGPQCFYTNRIFRMYKLLVLYELFHINYKCQIDELVENNEYIAKRKLLSDEIIKTEKHHDYIAALVET